MQYTWIATCKLGLEGIVADELRRLGAEDVKAFDARVYFGGDFRLMAKANLWLRSAERVFLQYASFEAHTFDELFEGVKAVAWEDVFEKDANILVKGKTAKSWLHSVSDAQAITKKAIIERLKQSYRTDRFPETGNAYIVEVGLLGNIVTVALDASGAGLNRRGYRTLNAPAPITETLAAALLQIMRYHKDQSFLDPMCGSGTLAIEAALIANNIAPGLCANRTFAAQSWGFMQNGIWQSEVANAKSQRLHVQTDIAASDCDGEMLRLVRLHAKQAGVDIRINQLDVKDLPAKACPGGLLITNPPYGERLLDRQDAERLYCIMGERFGEACGKYGIITAHPQFERYFGARANKRRKLYNGGIPCQFYQYF